jgi:hypothetical protein
MLTKITGTALALTAAVLFPSIVFAQNGVNATGKPSFLRQNRYLIAQESGGKPFVLGTETNIYNQDNPKSAYPAYPAYPVRPVTPPPVHRPVPQQPKVAPVHRTPPMQTSIQQNVVQQQPPPMQVQITQEQKLPPGVLPQQFLGTWAVLGSRTQASGKSPQYQEAVDRVMPATNNQEWSIVGQPGAYGMNSTSGASGIQVSQCTTSTAFIRHQYQIGNCIAREAYVLQLDPNGQSFQGVMKCAVVKPGESGPPRFSASYNLMGRRK